ncbi:MAG: hypothetical protein P4L33_02315 [Capsulimonadaceae bacterium]|nr:hypothetical protein [Capsulimonadaceae bacterium]
MLMPKAHKYVVPHNKITDYLLSSQHPDGRGKALFFVRTGFAAERWEELADALKGHARTCHYSSTVQSEYGTKYIIDGPMITPNARSVSIRSIWIVERNDPLGIPKLITAYPFLEKT